MNYFVLKTEEIDDAPEVYHVAPDKSPSQNNCSFPTIVWKGY